MDGRIDGWRHCVSWQVDMDGEQRKRWRYALGLNREGDRNTATGGILVQQVSVK